MLIVCTEDGCRRHLDGRLRVYVSLALFVSIILMKNALGAGHPGEEDIGGLVLVSLLELHLCTSK
jgi:hypothetical protein